MNSPTIAPAEQRNPGSAASIAGRGVQSSHAPHHQPRFTQDPLGGCAAKDGWCGVSARVGAGTGWVLIAQGLQTSCHFRLPPRARHHSQKQEGRAQTKIHAVHSLVRRRELFALVARELSCREHQKTRRISRTMPGRAEGVFAHVISIILMYCARHPWGKRSAVGRARRSPGCAVVCVRTTAQLATRARPEDTESQVGRIDTKRP
jgi:hypothetical protein